MEQSEIIASLAADWQLIPGNNEEFSISLLADRINELILHDFNKLISFLYRMDIDEAKIKALLKENTETDAGTIIANLVIERQGEKIKSRRQYRRRDNDISEEEKW